jgi:hypothetical protein
MNRKLSIILGIAAVAAVVASYALLYPARGYQGDGTIHDSGVVSFPRFRVEFLPMALDEPATRSFRFRRFPGNPASVFIQTPTEPAPEAIEQLVTSVTIRITDQDGSVVCSGTGFPAGRDGDRLVVTSGGPGVLGLWHAGCVDVSVVSCDPCTLEVSVANIDPATPSISVVPTLQGGGIELP